MYGRVHNKYNDKMNYIFVRNFTLIFKNSIMHNFSKRLAELVRASHATISEIAQEAHISRPSLYDLINGQSLPRQSTLEKLFNTLRPSSSQLELLRNLYQVDRQKSNRKERMEFHKKRLKLIREISDLLLAKGYEIARSTQTFEVDLVLRIDGGKRIPLLAYPQLLDSSQSLGNILTAMHELSSNQGILCVGTKTGLNRAKTTLFNKYRVKITTLKSLPRQL